MRLPPRFKLNLGLSLLLLLAGDVSLNPGPVAPNLRLGTVNARSMRDKAPALSDLVVSKGTDFLGITETWLTIRETSSDLAEMTPNGFSFYQTPRVNKIGGGVGLFVSNAFKFTLINLPYPVSNVYLANLNVVRLASIFSIFTDHLVLHLLSLVSCRIYWSTLPHCLMIWY